MAERDVLIAGQLVLHVGGKPRSMRGRKTRPYPVQCGHILICYSLRVPGGVPDPKKLPAPLIILGIGEYRCRCGFTAGAGTGRSNPPSSSGESTANSVICRILRPVTAGVTLQTAPPTMRRYWPAKRVRDCGSRQHPPLVPISLPLPRDSKFRSSQECQATNVVRCRANRQPSGAIFQPLIAAQRSR